MNENTMPENWVWTRLGDLCFPIADADFRRRASSSFQYIDISSIDREQKSITFTERIDSINAPSRARQVVAKKDVLVSTVRPGLNAVAVVPEHLDNEVCSTGFCVLRANPDVLDFEYLFAWVRSSIFIQSLIRMERGIGYPAVSNSDIENTLIPLPPLLEQCRIATILHEADEILKLRRQANEKTQEIVVALFYEMFGDPATNLKKLKTAVLGDVIYSAQDGPHVSPDYSEEGVPFLSTHNIRPGQVVWEDLKYISRKEAEKHWRKCKPERGDVLYTKGGTTGLAKAIDFDTEIAIWVHIALLKIKHDLVDPLWLESMLNSAFCYAQSQSLTHGITNNDLGLTRMIRINLYLPPLSLQQHFARQAIKVREAEHKQTTIFQHLGTLHQSLLARAFTGDLTATWREQHAEELVQAARERDHVLAQLRPALAELVTPVQPGRSESGERQELLALLNDVQRALLAMINEQIATYYTANSAYEELVTVECSLDVVRRELHFLAAAGWIKEQTLPAEAEADSVYYIPVYRSLLFDDNSQQPDMEQLIARLGSEYPGEVLV